MSRFQSDFWQQSHCFKIRSVIYTGGASSFIFLLLTFLVQVFILNEETQLLGCFMVFVGTMYSQAGDAIGKALDAKSNAVIA